MPTKINSTATIRLNQSSKVLMCLYNLPTLPTAYASNQANNITGKPVAMANITGRYKPLALTTVIGISIAKYSTPLYGQNASANTIPNKRVLQ